MYKLLQFATNHTSKFNNKITKISIVYICGVIKTIGKKTCTNIAKTFNISHDKVTRALIKLSLDIPNLDQSLLVIAQKMSLHQDNKPYLVIDETSIPKIFSKVIEFAAYGYNSIIGKPIKGLNIVVITWNNGSITIPLGFKFWIPRKSAHENYKKRQSLLVSYYLSLNQLYHFLMY